MTQLTQQVSSWSYCPDPWHPVEDYFRYCPASCVVPVSVLSESLYASWLQSSEPNDFPGRVSNNSTKMLTELDSSCPAMICLLPCSPNCHMVRLSMRAPCQHLTSSLLIEYCSTWTHVVADTVKLVCSRPCLSFHEDEEKKKKKKKR